MAEVMRGRTLRHVDVKLLRVGVATSGGICDIIAAAAAAEFGSLVPGESAALKFPLNWSASSLTSLDLFCIASSDTRFSLRGGDSIGDINGGF